MLLWTSNLHRPPPIYKTRTSRPWRLFDPATFRADLESSALCDERYYTNMDGDSLVALYNSTITGLLDQRGASWHCTTPRSPVYSTSRCLVALYNSTQQVSVRVAVVVYRHCGMTTSVGKPSGLCGRKKEFFGVLAGPLSTNTSPDAITWSGGSTSN